MNLKNVIIALFILLTWEEVSWAQNNFIIDNSRVNVESGAFMQVNGSIQFNPLTEMINNGEVQLTDDWINNSTTIALNNLSFGLVHFNGGTQNITGSDITEFYNVQLSGSNAVKSALIDVDIKNKLDLTNAILETNQSLVHLQSPNVDSLQWSTGFISGQNVEGYFLRSTNGGVPYAFPVGSSILTNNYRVVEVTPTTSDSSVYGVRLGDFDSSSEIGVSAAGSVAPFDATSKEVSLGQLNTYYFHSIHRFFGASEANGSIYFYDTDASGVVITAAHWDGVNNEWLDGDFAINPVNGANFVTYGSPNRVATSKFVLSFSDDQYVLSEVDLKFPTGLTNNGDGVNDYFVIENLDQYPENELEIYNRWGELIYQASPYLNDWDGTNHSTGVKIQGNTLQADTYFYLLKLEKDAEPIKNFLEIIND